MLIQRRLDSCFHVIYAKYSPYHPKVTASETDLKFFFFFLNLASIRWYRQTTDMIVQLGLSNYYSLYCSLKCACIGRHTSLCDTDSESLSKGV